MESCSTAAWPTPMSVIIDSTSALWPCNNTSRLKRGQTDYVSRAPGLFFIHLNKQFEIRQIDLILESKLGYYQIWIIIIQVKSYPPYKCVIVHCTEQCALVNVCSLYDTVLLISFHFGHESASFLLGGLCFFLLGFQVLHLFLFNIRHLL